MTANDMRKYLDAVKKEWQGFDYQMPSEGYVGLAEIKCYHWNPREYWNLVDFIGKLYNMIKAHENE